MKNFLKETFSLILAKPNRFVVVSLDVGPLSKGLEQKVMHKMRKKD